MKFELYTIVDITRTDARRGEDPTLYKKQQNYLTVLNTIGLRANPTIKKYPVLTSWHPNFGSCYNNVDKVWKLEFDIEYEDATNIELMQQDFELIPFISGLDETVVFKDCVFSTQNSTDKNIVFIQTE